VPTHRLRRSSNSAASQGVRRFGNWRVGNVPLPHDLAGLLDKRGPGQGGLEQVVAGARFEYIFLENLTVAGSTSNG
jgi:hypothetical protein